MQTVPMADWIHGWVEQTLEKGSVEVADFGAVLGRMGFTGGALDSLKPFLSPLYAWVASVDRFGKVSLPWSVAFLLWYVVSELKTERRCVDVRPRQPSQGPWFRADAKAEGPPLLTEGMLRGHSAKESLSEV